MPLKDEVLAQVAATLAAALIDKNQASFDPDYKTVGDMRASAVKLFGDLFADLQTAEDNRTPRGVLDKARKDVAG